MAALTGGSWAVQAQLNHGHQSPPPPPPPPCLCRFSSAPSSSSAVCRPPTSYGLTRMKSNMKKKIPMNAGRSPAFSVVASSDFAVKVASKFREDLFNELGKDETLSDTRGKIADLCAKVLQEYASTYSGVFTPPQPVDGMKKALQEQGLPTEKPLCCAIWWVRAHLNRDWEQFNALKP